MDVGWELFGLITGLVGCTSFLPQLWHTWKTQSGHATLLPFALTLWASIAGFVVYGLATGAAAVWITQGINTILLGTNICLALKFNFRDRKLTSATSPTRPRPRPRPRYTHAPSR